MKVKFIKNNAAAIGLAYMIGQEADLPELLAEQCIEDGYAVRVKVLVDLPEELPKREALIAAGITTVEAVEAASDKELEALKGIGKKSVEEIRAFLTTDEEPEEQDPAE